MISFRRLNSKLKVRKVEIKDLVTDLSDGVSICPPPRPLGAHMPSCRANTLRPGHANTPPGNSLE